MQNTKGSFLEDLRKLDLQEFVNYHIGGLLTVRKDGVILGIDESTATLFRQSREEIEGRKIFEFIPDLQLPDNFSTAEVKGRSQAKGRDGEPTDISYLLRGGWHQQQEAYFVLLQPKGFSLKELGHYIRIFDWMPVGIMIFHEGKEMPLACNRRLLELFGAENERQFLNEGPLSASSDNPIKSHLLQARKDRKERFEMVITREKEDKLCVEITLTPIPGLNHSLLLLLFQNITDRNESAQQLQDSRNTLEAVIRSAVDGLIIIDGGGIIQMVNKATTRLFGYAKEEMVGRNIKMLMPEPHRSQHDGYLEHHHQTGAEKIIGIGREVEGMRKDGKRFPFRLGVSRVETEKGVLFTGVIHDLTEQKAAEQKIVRLNRELEQKVEERTEKLTEVVNQLLQSNRQLEQEIKERKTAEEALRKNEEELRKALEREKELSELKSRFVSMASHEFRTPLTTIASSTELVSLYTSSEQQPKREKHLKRIQSAVTNLTGILGDFLSLSKLEEGKIQNLPVEFHLGELLEEVVDDLHSLLKPEQKIARDFDGVDQEIVLDKKILKIIFLNLLSNAIKYSGEGTTIGLAVKVNGQKLEGAVKDEGIGIPKEEQKHLFSRFFRAENVVNIQGTGLGLNIVKRYLELLKGDIRFESEEDKGTTFFFEIPL